MGDGKFHPSAHGWTVELGVDALVEAKAFILKAYPGQPEQKDMLGWLERFAEAVIVHPFEVLGYPPRQVASDSDMMYFPADPRAKISGIAHLSKAKKKIVIFKIVIKEREEKRS